jgi:hypothetical protein
MAKLSEFIPGTRYIANPLVAIPLFLVVIQQPTVVKNKV